MRRFLQCAFAVASLSASLATAKPYLPASEQQVLEVLPVSLTQQKALKQLRLKSETHPDRPDLALALARQYIQAGRMESDPRHYAHAEAVLEPWLKGGSPVPEALVLRATVLQNRHEFQAALADLQVALRINPRLPQAWLTRAAIEEAQGNAASALRSCLALVKYAAGLTGPVCLYSALSLSGQAPFAYQRLGELVGQTEADPDELQWTRGILAEIAERLGKAEAAESWHRLALDSGPHNAYLLAAYADFLLARRRFLDVIALLRNESRSDPLLLRLTIAEKNLNDTEFAGHRAELEARYAAADARSDRTHQGDQARFELFLQERPETALKLALANWQVQREPRDALILLQAALAAGSKEAAQPVREFIEASHLEDIRLATLLTRLNDQSQPNAALLSKK